MIELEVNGQRFTGFKEIAADRSYTEVPADFSFVATTEPDNLAEFPIKKGDKCRVIIDDQPFITGSIDVTEVVHDENRHEISVKGRSAVADLVDSTMDGNFEINGPIPLKTALMRIIELAGSDVAVIDKTGEPIEEFGPNENLAGEIGSPVWGFMVELAIKKQVLLTEDGQGNVIITRGEGREVTDNFVKKQFGQDNNIKGSRCRRSERERYNTYKVLSQDDSASLDGITLDNLDAVESSSKSGEAKDDAIRISRVKCLVAEKASQPSECTTRAVWQSNVSRVNAFSYSCDVQGFVTDSGLMLEPGLMPHVTDDFAQVDSALIIDKVSVTFTENGGSISNLDFVLPDAFRLIATEPKADDTGNDLDGFFG